MIYRCDMPECSWSISGVDEDDARKALGRHVWRRHEAVAEAEFFLATPDVPDVPHRRHEREPGCICPAEVWDPGCPVHVAEANW